MNKQVFQYLVFWQPTPKQEEKGEKAKIVVDVTTVVAKDAESVNKMAVRSISKEYDSSLDQISVVVRPF